MAFRLPCFAALLAILTPFAMAQVPSARAILDMPESDQLKFVDETMDAGFPDDRADQMTMLILNRSSIVLPVIEQRIEVELRSPLPSADFISTATEMIAYAGDGNSLTSIGRLITLNEQRFGPLVARALDNSISFRNPFVVAYRGIEMGNQNINAKVATWADTALGSPRMQRLWAEALVERYGRVPSDSEWTADPVTVLLAAGPELRGSVLELARQHVARTNKGR